MSKRMNWQKFEEQMLGEKGRAQKRIRKAAAKREANRQHKKIMAEAKRRLRKAQRRLTRTYKIQPHHTKPTRHR